MLRSKNILAITYWSFDNALIQTYTLPYLEQMKAIMGNGKIYLFTLLQNETYTAPVRLQIEELKKRNIYVLSFKYKNFGLLMLFKMVYILIYLVLLCFVRRIGNIHAWCTPGGAIGYVVSVFTGKPLVLDSFEPHATTMVEGGTWKSNSLAYKLLFKFERLQLKRAIEVICAAPGMIGHSQKIYGIKKQNYFVKPACVNLTLFKSDNGSHRLKEDLGLRDNVCVYAGKFGGIYLEKEVFDFLKIAYNYWQGNFSMLLLTSHSDEEIKNYCTAAGLPSGVIVKRFVNHSQMPQYLALGTFGFCPVKPLPSKEFCTPIKNGEYWAMGLPVVITKNISCDSAIIAQNNIGYVLNELNSTEYLKAIKAIDGLKAEKALREKIRAIAEKERNFSIAEAVYRAVYVQNYSC